MAVVHEVFVYIQFAVETGVLEHHAEFGAYFGGLQDNVRPADKRTSRSGPKHRGENAEQRGLSAAIGTKDGDN